MRSVLKLLASFLFLMTFTLSLAADNLLIDDFKSQPDVRWRFFADTVMGGVSTGQISFLSESGIQYAQMTGSVSTENNGGFIQMRTDLSSAPPEEIAGVRLIVRGNISSILSICARAVQCCPGSIINRVFLPPATGPKCCCRWRRSKHRVACCAKSQKLRVSNLSRSLRSVETMMPRLMCGRSVSTKIRQEFDCGPRRTS